MPVSENIAVTESQINRAIPVESIKTFVECIAERVVEKKRQQQRPDGWSPRSNPPYYKERFAVAIQVVIDEMMKDGEDRMYWYKDSPQISPDALYSRLYQGKKFLLDHMDPEKKYRVFCETFTISKQKGKGILLSVNKDVRENTTMLRPTPVSKVEVHKTWRNDVDEFLEDNTRKEFEKKKLALSDEDVIDLKVSLEQLDGILYDIDNTRIKIKKI